MKQTRSRCMTPPLVHGRAHVEESAGESSRAALSPADSDRSYLRCQGDEPRLSTGGGPDAGVAPAAWEGFTYPGKEQELVRRTRTENKGLDRGSGSPHAL